MGRVTADGLLLSVRGSSHRSASSPALLSGTWHDAAPLLEWNFNGTHLAVANRTDGSVAVLSLLGADELSVDLFVERAATGVVTDLVWSPSGDLLAVSSLVLPGARPSAGGGVVVLDSSGVKRSMALQSSSGFAGLSWHPTDAVLATTSIRFADGGLEMEPLLLDIEANEWSPILNHSDTLQCYGAVFSPAGDALALLASDSSSGVTRVVFASADGRGLTGYAGTFTAEGFDALGVVGHDPSSRGPYWSVDSRWVAIGSEDGAWFYDTAAAVEFEVGNVLESVAAFRAGCWSPDGSRFAWAGLRSVFLWTAGGSREGGWELCADSVMWALDGSLFALGIDCDGAQSRHVWRLPAPSVGLQDTGRR